MRRNDIVYDKTDNAPWIYYGRIVRLIDSETALWINCNREIHITRLENLVKVDGYKGKWEPRGDFEYWVPMPTLRRLKQMASMWHERNVWKTTLDYSGIWENKP